MLRPVWDPQEVALLVMNFKQGKQVQKPQGGKMKLDWRLVLVLVMSLGLMVGCTSDDDEEEVVPVGTFADVSAYMTNNGLDLPAMLTDWVIPASSVVNEADGTVPDYTVLDIRSAADFAAGHIAGAINTTLGGILTAADGNAPGTNGYLVVCVTGQTAGHAVMALRLMGEDAKVLKFGFSGWNTAFEGPWAGATGNRAVGHANWVTTADPGHGTYEYPDWESTTTEGAALLVERVEATLANGFKAIDGHTSATSVLEAPENYQIFNFWTAEDYLAFGHFDGAMQLKPISLAGDEITAIDPAMTGAIYCFTGQTSSMVTFWLNTLGYDMNSIKFGVNALNYDGLHNNDPVKPTWHGAADYMYVEG